MAKGQGLGECGGCESGYGVKLGVDEVAWINVQPARAPQPSG